MSLLTRGIMDGLVVTLAISPILSSVNFPLLAKTSRSHSSPCKRTLLLWVWTSILRPQPSFLHTIRIVCTLLFMDHGIVAFLQDTKLCVFLLIVGRSLALLRILSRVGYTVM